MELCKHVQTKFVPSGALLFGPGFKNDSIYVVRNGRLKVFIIEPVSECSGFFSDLLFNSLRPIACIHTQYFFTFPTIARIQDSHC